MYKLLSLTLCLIMLAGVIFSVPATVSAADTGSIYPSTAEGECGDNAYFYCFPDQSMAIFGNGPIKDYELSANNVSTAPWYGQLDHLYVSLFINKIAIEYGVTRIGDYAFYFPDSVVTETGAVDNQTYAYYRMIAQLYNVDIAYTVTSIGKYAFYNQKMEHITIPGQVTHIGENAFLKSSLQDITYYGDPAELTWEGDEEFTSPITVYVPSTYADQLSTPKVTELASRKNITFSATIDNPYDNIEDKDRNIAAYFGSTNSKVFGGAAPFIIVGKFDNVKKSTTYGSAGYASCVKVGNDYYVLTNTATGELKLSDCGNAAGKVTSCTTVHPDLQLRITPEYIGPDIVKIKYSLTNTNASGENRTYTNLMLGGTGDIKIGADDKASLEPLNEGGDQVGIYMRSRKSAYDKSGSDYATFGFIGKNVTYKKTVGEAETQVPSPDAKFFYGAVASNKPNSATGAMSAVLMPERIFTPNNGTGSSAANLSYSSGDFNRTLTQDAGLSFYWDEDDNTEVSGITLAPGETKEFAVSFSVYGVTSTKADNYTGAPDEDEINSADNVIDDVKLDDNDTSFSTVTWIIPGYSYTSATDSINVGEREIKQIVKVGDVPVYGNSLPKKESDYNAGYNWVFDGWTVKDNEELVTPSAIGETGATYYAHFKSVSKERLFKGHSLTLNGDIGVNFYLKKSMIDDLIDAGNNVRITFTRYVMGEAYYPYVDFEKNVTPYENVLTEDVGTADCYKVSVNVPAAEMAHNIHAVVTYGTGPTSTWSTHWDKDDYSVREYGMEIVNHSDLYSDRLVNLAKEMLNYGTQAQIIFDRLDAPYAGSGIDYAPTDPAVTLDEAGNAFSVAVAADKINKSAGIAAKTDMTAGTSDFGLTYCGATVVFLSKTSLRLYYYENDDAESPATDYTIFDRSKNRSVTEGFKKNAVDDEMFYAEFTDIPAAELDTLQMLTIGTHTYYYSVLDYAKLLFDFPEAGDHYTVENEKNFARSIYLYNHAANEYFDNLP